MAKGAFGAEKPVTGAPASKVPRMVTSTGLAWTGVTATPNDPPASNIETISLFMGPELKPFIIPVDDTGTTKVRPFGGFIPIINNPLDSDQTRFLPMLDLDPCPRPAAECVHPGRLSV